MFGLPGRPDTSPEVRGEIQDYLRDIEPLLQKVEEEYRNWLELATEDDKTLSIERDPDGQHASIYLWRVGEAATSFVQKDPARPARRYYEAIALCLENRAAAADLFREGADLALLKNPGSKIDEANRKLAEADRLMTRAQTAHKQLLARYVN